MRYAKEHRTKTRQKIVENAYRLFVAKGYAATSIDEIMRACGLTHGGFYAYFKRKSALYREAFEYAARHGELLAPRADGGAEGWVDAMLEEHVRPEPQHLPGTARLGFFVVDAANRDAAVRAAYTDAFKFVAAGMRRCAPAPRLGGEDAALGLAAMIVGAAAIARTTDDAALKRKLLKSCRESARVLLERPQDQVFPVYFWVAAN